MAEQANPAAQKHVLVVDDNVELAQTFQELLELQGYRVSLAHEGVQALASSPKRTWMPSSATSACRNWRAICSTTPPATSGPNSATASSS